MSHAALFPVVDLYIAPTGITLIELNPYGLSDPCLLNYAQMADSTECVFQFNMPT
jgi:hypothetical protein